MSKQVSQEQTSGIPRKASGGRSIMTGILLLPVVVVLFPSTIVLLAGMVPSVVAYFVDRTGGKYLAITVALLNFCGTLLGLTRLWQQGQTLDAGLRIATDPLHWLVSYGAAAGGWLIYLSIPPILAIYYTSISTNRIEALKRKQAELVETWGSEVVPGNLQDPSED
jgi:hypothetical protein